MKGLFIYFDTENIAHLVKKEIKDGMVEIGDKAWDISKFKPFILKKGLSYVPLYFIKWDNVYPANLTVMKPEFNDNNIEINPEILRKTMSLKILGNMLKIRKPFPPLLLIILGLIFGGFLTYLLIAMKLIII